MLDKTVENSIIYPVRRLPIKETPTVAVINIGPGLLQNDIIHCASSFVINFLSYKSAVILAPVGYPAKSPMISGKAPHPFTLKITRTKKSSFLPKYSANPVSPSIEMPMANGNSVGKTPLYQSIRLFDTDEIKTDGYSAKNANDINMIIDKNVFLKANGLHRHSLFKTVYA